MNETERAERMQAWKAFLIPSSLFVACLFNAAGIYIIYAGNGVGVVFVGLGFAIIVGGLFLFVTFQNKARAAGQWRQVSDRESVESPPVASDRGQHPSWGVEDFTPADRAKYPQWGTELGGTEEKTPVDPFPVIKLDSNANIHR